MLDLQAARDRLSGGNAATALLRRLADNDKQQRMERDAAEGIIGHCDVCKKPFPDRPSYIKYVCPECAEKKQDEKHPVYRALEALGNAAASAVKEVFRPSAPPVGAGPKLPAIPRTPDKLKSEPKSKKKGAK